MDSREKLIEAATEFARNSMSGSYVGDMADFALEQIEKQRLQFTDAIPAMKEAYEQGKADRDAEWVAAGQALEITLMEEEAPLDDYERGFNGGISAVKEAMQSKRQKATVLHGRRS